MVVKDPELSLKGQPDPQQEQGPAQENGAPDVLLLREMPRARHRP